MSGNTMHGCHCGNTALVHEQPVDCDRNAVRGQALTVHNRNSMRGQATTEMLVLVGFALVFIIPIAFLFLSASNNELSKTSIMQAKATARTIADNAGEIYLQGPGARKYIVVNYPQGVTNAIVGNGVVVLTLDSNGYRQDIVATTFANITGDLTGKRGAGLQTIKLVNDDDVVKITYQ